KRGLGLGLARDREQVFAVTALLHLARATHEPLLVDIAHAVADLFEAGDLHALSLLERLHEARRREQRLEGAGVEPGKAASHPLDRELAGVEIEAVEVGDFKFAAR